MMGLIVLCQKAQLSGREGRLHCQVLHNNFQWIGKMSEAEIKKKMGMVFGGKRKVVGMLVSSNAIMA